MPSGIQEYYICWWFNSACPLHSPRMLINLIELISHFLKPLTLLDHVMLFKIYCIYFHYNRFQHSHNAYHFQLSDSDLSSIRMSHFWLSESFWNLEYFGRSDPMKPLCPQPLFLSAWDASLHSIILPTDCVSNEYDYPPFLFQNQLLLLGFFYCLLSIKTDTKYLFKVFIIFFISHY